LPTGSHVAVDAGAGVGEAAGDAVTVGDGDGAGAAGDGDAAQAAGRMPSSRKQQAERERIVKWYPGMENPSLSPTDRTAGRHPDYSRVPGKKLTFRNCLNGL
jgi:hypothetical protein